MHILLALLSGILFGIGLTVAQMTNPQKVLDFLDIAAIFKGGWDPTLLMVFVGALPVMFAAYRVQAGQAKPWFDSAFYIPTRKDIDGGLVTGSTMFGVGWGLVGLCPGPAVVALALMSRPMVGRTVLFFGTMMFGIWLANILRLSGSAREAAAV
jgi:uncharacterized protein